MTCAACVRRVENALNSVTGVLDASVNLANGRATIIHGPKWDGLAALKKVITEQGYEFLGELKDNLADPIEASRVKELKDLKLKVTCGAILSVIIFLGSMQHWFGFLQIIPRPIMLWAMFILTAPAVFWVGSRFFIGAIKAASAENIRYEHSCCCGGSCRLCLLRRRNFFSSFFYDSGRNASRLL